MSSSEHTQDSNEVYFVPEGSNWPIIAVLAMFLFTFGLVLAINGVSGGSLAVIFGFVAIIYLMEGWFGSVIDESMSGKYNAQVDRSFRQGMIWFIGSEAAFFITFFGCLFYLRAITLPYLGGEGQLGTSNMLWEGFSYSWPLLQMPDMSGSVYVAANQAMGPWGIPLINTILLLSSGVTLTWAHWGLKKNDQKQLVSGLIMTVALGGVFFLFQAYEYYHAYVDLGLTLNAGVYGSTFYMLTGFHGFHVILGSIMLVVVTVRAARGHFSEENHFAFEAVAWYWHFVDVVWIALFIFVYWL